MRASPDGAPRPARPSTPPRTAKSTLPERTGSPSAAPITTWAFATPPRNRRCRTDAAARGDGFTEMTCRLAPGRGRIRWRHRSPEGYRAVPRPDPSSGAPVPGAAPTPRLPGSGHPTGPRHETLPHRVRHPRPEGTGRRRHTPPAQTTRPTRCRLAVRTDGRSNCVSSTATPSEVVYIDAVHDRVFSSHVQLRSGASPFGAPRRGPFAEIADAPDHLTQKFGAVQPSHGPRSPCASS